MHILKLSLIMEQMAEVAALMVEAEGMKTENCKREAKGESQAYDEGAFLDIAGNIRGCGQRIRTTTMYTHTAGNIKESGR